MPQSFLLSRNIVRKKTRLGYCLKGREKSVSLYEYWMSVFQREHMLKVNQYASLYWSEICF